MATDGRKDLEGIEDDKDIFGGLPDWGRLDDDPPPPTPRGGSAADGGRADPEDDSDPFMDGFGGFDEAPTPKSGARDAALGGFEFEAIPGPAGTRHADLGGDEFDDVESAIRHPAPPAAVGRESSEAFTIAGSGSFAEDGEDDDPFEASSEMSETDLEEWDDGEIAPAPTPPSAPSRGLSRFIFPGAAIAAVAVVGFVGYSFLGQSGGGSLPRPVAAVEPPTAAFPSALPGQPGGIPAIGAPDIRVPVDQAALPVPSELGAPPTRPVVMPSADPFDTPAPMPTPSDVDLASDASLPGKAAVSIRIPDLSAPGVDQIDDLVGGPDRGGIEAIRAEAEGDSRPAQERTRSTATATPVSVADADVAHALDEIRSRLTSVDTSLSELRETITRMGDRMDAAPPRPIGSAAGADVPATSPDEMVPPLKPPLIDGVSLKGVSRDMAWIDAGSGITEIRVGDEIPGGGEVVGFRRYDGDWIVVTDEGIVTR